MLSQFKATMFLHYEEYNTIAIFAAMAVVLLLFLVSYSSIPSVITKTIAQQIPLTPQELEQQNRLQNVIAATTRNLEQ
jgi:hypothetical protein